MDLPSHEIGTGARDSRKVKILALELSSRRGSLAWRNNDHADLREWPNDRKNSGPFFENLLTIRKQFGVPDQIIVGLGPGSYAGVRIAISTAIGLEALSQTQLLGYPSICAIKTDATAYCVIGDARRQSFFFARIGANKLVEGPILLAEYEVREKLARLDGIPVFSSDHLSQFERVRIGYPSASVLAALARNSDHPFALPPLEPIYLREPYVTMPGSDFQSKIAP
jgi:tRNA threonylcarbamoyladenosine biosynthesis protein TsaB